ncbi:MAG TPA: 3-phosphoshikimate 1-carboxyvinyltransferase [Acidimicrobiia bacterium]
MNTFRLVKPLGRGLDATLRPPGSKSETIRALVAAALATGNSRIGHPLDAEDTRFARDSLRQLGAGIDDDDGQWSVSGTGGRLHRAGAPLDAGASGLTARCLIAIAPLADGPITIVGRDRLPERPMGGLVDALRRLGVEARATDGRLPVTIDGKASLPGGVVDVDSRETTQYLTALLLAAPLAQSAIELVPIGLGGSQGYLDVTIRVMEQFGAQVERVAGGYRVEPGGYRATQVDIEPDASAAVYPMVAAAITRGRVLVQGLGSRSLQPDMEIARVLATMGCEVEQTESTTIVDARDRELHPVDVDLSGSPDGSLAVAVACLFAGGVSTLRGLGSLRFKESDRLTALARELRRIGAEAMVDGDVLTIVPGEVTGARIETYQDHRIAMAFGLVGLLQPGIEISDPEVVGKTWPGYWDVLSGFAGDQE